jgi:hypothetical protein
LVSLSAELLSIAIQSGLNPLGIRECNAQFVDEIHHELIREAVEVLLVMIIFALVVWSVM